MSLFLASVHAARQRYAVWAGGRKELTKRPIHTELCGTPAFRPNKPVCFHGVAQQQIGLGLVAAPIAFQPLNHIVVQPHRHRTLDGPVEAADFSACPIDNLGRIAEINRSVRLGGDGGDLPSLRGCELLHRTSFPGRMRHAPR